MSEIRRFTPWLFASAAAVVAITLTSVPAWSRSKDFSIRNRTEATISGFWLKTPDSDKWVPMRGYQIAPGTATDVTFEYDGPCNMQFRIQTSQGVASFNRPFDFCALRSISIYYDAQDKVFTAKENL